MSSLKDVMNKDILLIPVHTEIPMAEPCSDFEHHNYMALTKDGDLLSGFFKISNFGSTFYDTITASWFNTHIIKKLWRLEFDHSTPAWRVDQFVCLDPVRCHNYTFGRIIHYLGSERYLVDLLQKEGPTSYHEKTMIVSYEDMKYAHVYELRVNNQCIGTVTGPTKEKAKSGFLRWVEEIES